MRNRFFPLLTFMLSGIFGATAQDPGQNNFNSYYANHYENETPATPSAANFLQYGNTPVNISRGLPSISIPIYTLEVDGIQFPISISYDASGVKVDDISSTVGLKWTLNAGGGIFRTVKDKDDFGRGAAWIRGSTNQSHFEGWWGGIQPDENWFKTKDHQHVIESHIGGFDQWPDDFRYSFLGHSGEFKFSPDGTIIKGVNDGIALQPHNIDDPNLWDSYFTAKDQDGNSFSFSNNRFNKDISSMTYHKRLYHTNEYQDGGGDSHFVGWHMDNIETKNGKQIEIDYENIQNGSSYNFPYTIGPISEQLQRVRGCGTCPNIIPWDCVTGDHQYAYYYYYRTHTEITYSPGSSFIKKIKSENTDIEFVYLDNDIMENGIPTVINGWKKRISTIIITDKIGGRSKKFHFKYGVFSGEQRLKLIEIQEEGFAEEGFEGKFKPPYRFTYNEAKPIPPLGSKSKDYMGYYNGKNNRSLLPKTEFTLGDLDPEFTYEVAKHYDILADRYFDADFISTGVLSQIEYPTGGKTEFSYEVNALGPNLREPLLKLREKIISNRDFETIDLGSPVAPFNKYVYSQLIDIKNVAGRFKLTMLADCPDCYCEEECLEVPKIKMYKYNGAINDDPEDYFLNGKFDPYNPVLQSAIKNTSGINLTSFDPSKGNGVYIVLLLLGGDPMVSQYDPETYDVQVGYSWNEQETDTNGNVVFQENYFGGLRIQEIKDFDVNNLKSSHKTYTYNEFYQHVTAGFKSENYYKRYDNGGGPSFIYSGITETNPFYPLVTGYCYTDVDTGIIGSGNLQIVNEKFRANQVFNSIMDGLPTEKSIFDNTGQLLEYTEFLYRDESVTPTLGFYTPSEKIFPIIYRTSCGNQWPDKIVSGFSHLRIPNEFYSVHNLLSSKKSTQLFKNGTQYEPVTTITDFAYNSNRLIASEIVDTKYTAILDGGKIIDYILDNPNGEIITVDYRYVDDPIVNPPLTSLPVGLPISKEVTNGTTKIQGQYFEYTYFGNIKNTYRYNKGKGSHSGGPGYIPQDYELDASYLTDQGKPTQVKGADGVITSYIWGYNEQYPVVKITNVPYSVLVSDGKVDFVHNLPYYNNENDQESLISNLNTLRSFYPNAQVITYTYSPMVGVSTITDPKGLRVDYIYDGLGRLEYVRDQERNILGKNEYHYKND